MWLQGARSFARVKPREEGMHGESHGCVHQGQEQEQCADVIVYLNGRVYQADDESRQREHHKDGHKYAECLFHLSDRSTVFAVDQLSRDAQIDAVVRAAGAYRSQNSRTRS